MAMALSQIQIIQSLAEALTWLEKELAWGVTPAQLTHLTGRIGELYVAMLTRGQMALATNQRGYDVVGMDGERISVKTVTSSGRAPFNPNTIDLVDRIVVLRVNIDEDSGVSVETLLDINREEFDLHLRRLGNGDIDFPIRQRREPVRPITQQSIDAEVVVDGYTVRQLESGTIVVLDADGQIPVAMPVLRALAARTGVDLLNSQGQQKNTRQLGAGIIKAAQTKHE